MKNMGKKAIIIIISKVDDEKEDKLKNSLWLPTPNMET